MLRMELPEGDCATGELGEGLVEAEAVKNQLRWTRYHDKLQICGDVGMTSSPVWSKTSRLLLESKITNLKLTYHSRDISLVEVFSALILLWRARACLALRRLSPVGSDKCLLD